MGSLRVRIFHMLSLTVGELLYFSVGLFLYTPDRSIRFYSRLGI